MVGPHLRPLALVTGASMGIGLELARELVIRGYDLVIAADHEDTLNDAAQLLSTMEEAPTVEVVVVDLSTTEGVRALYEATKLLGRDLDVLAANAGIGLTGEFAWDTDLDAELAVIQLNVVSQVHLIKLIVRDMVVRGEGRILITSSVAAMMPGPYYAVYAASKAFLRSFGQAIREELSGSGVTVTVLLPGPTDTHFFERAAMEHTVARRGPKQSAVEVARAAIKGLEEGTDHVVPGTMNKLQVGVAKVMPDVLGAMVQGSQVKPGRL